MDRLIIQRRATGTLAAWPRACGICLLWSLSLFALAQGDARSMEEEAVSLDGVNLMEALSEMSAPNSQILLERDYRECVRSERRVAQRSSVEIDLTTTCSEQKQALTPQVPPEFQAKAEAIKRDNEVRIKAQRDALAAADAREPYSASREQDHAPGRKIEERHLAKLSACYRSASRAKGFDASLCPELVGLDAQDMEQVNSYLAELTAIRAQ